VTKEGPGDQDYFLQLDPTFVISQQNIVIDVTWIKNSETCIISPKAFWLTHTSVAKSKDIMLKDHFHSMAHSSTKEQVVEDGIRFLCPTWIMGSFQSAAGA
jgi:hypothetical protein